MKSSTKLSNPRRQTSDSFVLNCILAVSGGFQDAYTYYVRGHVFSNAQTGNVIIMSQNLMEGKFAVAIRYLLPIFAFALGVLVAEQLRHKYKHARKLHWRQSVVAIEMIILFIVGLIPSRLDMVATALVSFSCSMQVQAFRTMHGHGYASTMCIGNLRSGTESLSKFLRSHKRKDIVITCSYYGVIAIFALGAGLGALISMEYGLKAIWICDLLLVIVFCMMFARRVNKRI